MNIIEQRSKIYKNFKFYKKKSILFDLSINIKENNEIKKNLQNIIKKNLEKFYKRPFFINKNYLVKYNKLIKKLPNITPNGAINCTPEIYKEFNELHKSLIKIFKKYNIIDNLHSCTNIVPRIRFGKENKKRSYATTKVHSDAWNGQACDAIIMFMADGDIYNNCVKFYKPTNPKKNILKKMKTFDEGYKYFDNLRYLKKCLPNHFYILDQICLHKSYNSSDCKPRISIDFGVNILGSNSSALFKKKSKRYNYIKIKEWKNLNYKNLKQFKSTLKELEECYH